MSVPTFLSCDWGTSRFRLRVVDYSSGEILETVQSDEGAVAISSRCAPEARARAFEQTLFAAIAKLPEKCRSCKCVISGMASSRIGWKELSYAKLPMSLSGKSLVIDELSETALLISGVASDEDILRGEETELVGLGLLIPEIASIANGLVIIPGTHSKHMQLSGGAMSSFHTFMTGELFAHLKQLPTFADLLKSQSAPTDLDWFNRGVDAAQEAGALSSLFKIRARGILTGISGQKAVSYLSGLLIGEEMAATLKQSDSKIWLACGGELADLYRLAAERAGGFTVETIPPHLMQKCVSEAHRQLLKDRNW